MSRKMKKNGVISEVAFNKNKKYKYDTTGDLVEFTGDPGVNEITVSGSKSSLRRVADMERNISILATQLLTTDGGTSLTPTIVQATASADATTKADAALVAAKSYADQAESDAESAASTDASTKAGNAKSQAISAASSDATSKANAARQAAISAASQDATNKANNAKTQAIAAVLGGAGPAYDTLQEIKILIDAGDQSLNQIIGGLPSPGNGTVSVSAGTGISTGGSFSMNQGHSETITISHSDTSNQSSVNNGGRTYIQDITLDSMGHITGLSSATETVVNTDTNTWRPISDSVVSSSTSTSASSKAVKAAYDRTWPNTHRGISNSVSSTSTSVSASSAAVKAAYDRSWPDTNTHRGISNSTSSTSTSVSASSAAVKAAYDRSWPDTNTTYSAAQMLTAIKTVDGAGSGLDADLLDGVSSGSFLRSDATDTATGFISLRAGGDHLGNHTFASASHTSTGYGDAGIEVREGGYGSGTGKSAPRIGMHWGGVVASNISMETNGTITIRNNPGTGFESFKAANITANGAILATGNITAYSDARLKKDVETIENAMDKVSALNGVNFTRISDDTRSTGLIAQEVLAVLPEAVATDEEGMHSVAYGNVVGLLVEAIKEQDDKITRLEKMVESLLNK